MELYLPYYEDRPNVRTLNGVLFETNGDVAAALGRIAAYIDESLHAGLSVTIGRELIELPADIFRRYNIPQEQLDAFWSPYRPAIQPSVIHDGTTYFWQLPSANTLAQDAGWQMEAVSAWGWQAANIGNVDFENGWCFDPASRSWPERSVARTGCCQRAWRRSDDGDQSRRPDRAAFLRRRRTGRFRTRNRCSGNSNGDGEQHTYTVPLRWRQAGMAQSRRSGSTRSRSATAPAASRTCVQQLRFIR